MHLKATLAFFIATLHRLLTCTCNQFYKLVYTVCSCYTVHVGSILNTDHSINIKYSDANNMRLLIRFKCYGVFCTVYCSVWSVPVSPVIVVNSIVF